ncbi:hypothetical protein, partial [Klebsiella pneumoniae]|uniref:hypothetical protein n=1 Tax=Klebsiella pneumoniae TaxID=573 RepID=UPI0037C080E1
TETEATGAPQKHHYTLNQQVGSITQQPYSVPVLIAVSIPFDVAAAVIFAVRQKQKNLKKTICLGR